MFPGTLGCTRGARELNSASAASHPAADPLQSLPDPEPPPAALPPDPGPGEDALGSDTAEYELEEIESDDVLEETPEFLQDTPDHDRLWFEQRPPKDFDFDE